MTLNYPGADRSQWFGDRYPGAVMRGIRIGLFHTTEGTSWPGYNAGATAPHLTIRANERARRLEIRQHFSLDRSARALRNEPGGVETNTAGVIQLELVGTCYPDGPGLVWPDAPSWALEQLGDVVRTIHKIAGVPMHSAVEWRTYPDSYGKRARQRLTADEWRTYRGWLGHQHVPENDHGDPGNLPIGRIIAAALDLESERRNMNNVERARAELAAEVFPAMRSVITLLRNARKADGRRRPVVDACAATIRAAYGMAAGAYRVLPRK